MPAVQDLKTSGTSSTCKITLPVDGMTCAACQATVQRALTKAPGVTKAAVNLMTNEATVHYDPAATDPSRSSSPPSTTPATCRTCRPPMRRAAADEAREQAQAREYVDAAQQGHRQPHPRRRSPCSSRCR